MVPYAYNRHHHVACSRHQVEHEQQEVPLVLHTDAVVDPGTVMIHEVDTFIANGAVVSACWLDNITFVALFGPKFFQLGRCFAAVT